MSADAGGLPEKQLADIDGLIAKAVKALIILVMREDAIVPALANANSKNIPVIGYNCLDRSAGRFPHHL